ncbi:TMCO4 family protein [Vibrio sp. Isolate34]|uniref:DUF726 domain-containing protein n=1 Tax=Vibrio sp. Isolate34 TaxID=2908540 RepID=UPI001EFC784A|nr:DUF726 domain-containing protein [Vibrio sp. Isolate34]MCG9640051.1 TMCO4 family protein [Vibrio sp. Isolate34]
MPSEVLPLEVGQVYSFTTIREGIEPIICVINGFMSESASDVEDWLSIIDVLYPNNKVVHFSWPAGNLKNMLFDDESAMKPGVAASLLRSNPLGLGVSVVIDRVAGRWRKSLKNAEKAGQFLANHINQSQEKFVLMGHSLGARVSYYALDDLSRYGAIESAILFGGAITHTGEWQKILQRNKDLWICNNYSHNDSVLKFLYKVGTLFTNRPIGLNRIKATHPHLYNFNTSEYVSGHTAYKNRTVGNFLAWKFSEVQELQALTQQFIINKVELSKLQNKALNNNQNFTQQLNTLDAEQQHSLDAINKI